MSDKCLKLSKLDCLNKLEKLTNVDGPSSPKKQKLGTFENLKEILSEFDVSVTSAPLEKDLRTIWQKEKKKILSKFNQILDERATHIKHKSRHAYFDGPFFDSNDYKVFTSLVEDSAHDPDYIMDVENDTSETETESKAEQEKTMGCPPSDKPLSEFSDPMIRKKTDPILQSILKASSELKMPPDKLVAKTLMRIYFTAGEHFNKKKGQMFNKVVTLEKFMFLFSYCHFVRRSFSGGALVEETSHSLIFQ